MRRRIYITNEQFDFSNDPLTSEDLVDEFQRSKVYDFSTKEKLADILSQSITLCITLTDTLLLIFPPNGLQGPLENDHDKDIHKLQECRTSLRRWHEFAAIKMPKRSSCTRPSTTPQTNQGIGEASIILYANLVYMYYHTARIVICHYEALHLNVLSGGANGNYSLIEDLSTIFKTRRELQDATSDIAECHKKILLLGLAQFLPNSAIGFIILPLVLNILDVKLCPLIAHAMHQTSATTQHQLNILIQFVRAYWTRYDGRLPQDGDFPVKLRGLFSTGVNPLRELIEGHHQNAVEDHNSASAPSLQNNPHISTKSSFDGRLHQTILGLDECLVTILESGINFLEPEQVANTNISQSQGEEADNGGGSGDQSSSSSFDDSEGSSASSGKAKDKGGNDGSQHWADVECQAISGFETGIMSGVLEQYIECPSRLDPEYVSSYHSTTDRAAA
ncbi:Cutinase transcription factor 1 beta-like protein [Ilyonectria robusta]